MSLAFQKLMEKHRTLLGLDMVAKDHSRKKELEEAEALALGGPEALEPLIKALENANKWKLQLAALNSIVRLHERGIDVASVFHMLVKLQGSITREYSKARLATAVAIGKKFLHWALDRINADPMYAQECAPEVKEVLARFAPDPELMKFLDAGSHSSMQFLRVVVASIIGDVFRYNREAANQEMICILMRLQLDSTEHVRNLALMALAEAPKRLEKNFDALVRSIDFKDKSPAFIDVVLSLIGERGKRAKGAVPALLALRNDPPGEDDADRSEIRVAATRALCMIEPERTIEFLNELVDIEGAVTSWTIVGMMDPRKALDLLRTWFGDDRPKVVETALDTAVHVGGAAACLAVDILPFLVSDNRALRKAAAKALRDIAGALRDWFTETRGGTVWVAEDEKEKRKADYNAFAAMLKEQTDEIRRRAQTADAATRKYAEAAVKAIGKLKKA